MLWGFILLLILFIAIAFAFWWRWYEQKQWDRELTYLTRHEPKSPNKSVNNQDDDNQKSNNWTTWFIKQKEKFFQKSPDPLPKEHRSDDLWPFETEDTFEELDDLPIFAQVSQEKQQHKTFRQPEKAKDKAWNKPFFAYGEDASVLSDPDENLAIITLPEITREKPKEQVKIIEVIDFQVKDKKSSKQPSKPINPNLPVIEMSDIRANLLRLRDVRRQDEQRSSSEYVPIRPQTIQQDEILANLVNTDSPVNRLQYKIKRETVRESIIPEDARKGEQSQHTQFSLLNKQPISTRFTPYDNPPAVPEKKIHNLAQGLLKEDVSDISENTHQDHSIGNWRTEFKALQQELAQSNPIDDVDLSFDAPKKHSFSVIDDSLNEENNWTAESWDDPFHSENQTTSNFSAEKKTAQFEEHLNDDFSLDEPFFNDDSQAVATPTFRQPESFLPPKTSAINAVRRLSSHIYPLPDLSLLLPAKINPNAHLTDEEMLQTGILIEEKLQEFRVKVSVVDAYAGPVITRYEIEPDVGVRGNQVINLEKDLARALGCASIRIVETIPGKTCMGLELPNPQRQMIRLSQILGSDIFRQSASRLTVALGHDISGQPIVTDLAKAPHLLVAGTTGSGKSVGVNAMILSILFKATPDEVRMIMIDPKMLELSVYEGIPHLLAPVVTDMKLAANALIWCVNEMEKRYRLMSHAGVRNLAGFNQRIEEAQRNGQRLSNPFSLNSADPEPLEKLPFIVVIVDEFADLMMSAGKKIEELIARLAQKARAAGIHLILATQRPSVDVITGLIKANIPTRIAFQVSSKIDSRTILDQMGAENLLGQGDMLFLPPGSGYPQRVHGAFVADEEVHQVAEYLKQFGEPDYVEDILTAGVGSDDLFSNGNNQRNNDGEEDPMYDNAVAFVLQTRKASISAIQRHLRIGYNRAARIVESMEQTGLLSAPESNGVRTVLTPEQ